MPTTVKLGLLNVFFGATLLLAPSPCIAAAEATAAVTSVSHVGISVSDIKQTIALFRDVLGATVEEPRAVPTGSARITGVREASILMAYITLAGQRIEFVQYLNPTGAPSKLRPPNPGHFHIGLVVKDYAATMERLRMAGFDGPVPETRDGKPRPVYLTNRDGIVFELFPAPS